MLTKKHARLAVLVSLVVACLVAGGMPLIAEDWDCCSAMCESGTVECCYNRDVCTGGGWMCQNYEGCAALCILPDGERVSGSQRCDP